MDHNSYFYNEADQMHNFNESFQTFDEQAGFCHGYYPSYEHEETRWLQHHDFSWDSQYQQNLAYEEHNYYFPQYHPIPENNYYMEHQFDYDDYQPYSRVSCESESSTELTPFHKKFLEFKEMSEQREAKRQEQDNNIIEMLNNMQNMVERTTKTLSSWQLELSSSTGSQNLNTNAYYDDTISLVDYEVQEEPQETEVELNQTFESTIIEEYGEIECKEEETLPTCVVEVSQEEIQDETVPDFIITSNTPSQTFDVQQQDEGYVLKNVVLEQPSNKEGSNFIKVALEDDTEVLKRVSFGVS